MMLAGNAPKGKSVNQEHMSDQQYLLSHQYKDASVFSTCMQIMQRLHVNPANWHRQIFEHIRKGPHCQVLELGCGPGFLWQYNRERIPSDWTITLSDFSPGMLKGAEENLSQIKHRITFQVIDAQAIPFKADLFDRVIANCMLYHVPDRPCALSEISRVLKPDGFFYAATFSKDVFAEIEYFLRKAGIPSSLDAHFVDNFSLENGREQLSPYFSQIQLHPLEQKLSVTEADSFVALIRAGMFDVENDEAGFQRLHEMVQQEIAQKSEIRMNFNMGLFEAFGPKSHSKDAGRH